MAGSQELDKMRSVVKTELRDWKIAMDELAGIFHKRFPPIGRREGWTLHVDRCAKTKGCKMCPHSIYWHKYHWGKLTEAGKQKLRAQGKKAPNNKLMWNREPSAKSRTCLPPDLCASDEILAIFREFEVVRATIMAGHKVLADLHKSLACKQSAERRNLKLRDPAPAVMTDARLVDTCSEMLRNLPSKKNLLVKLGEMRKKYPPSGWAKKD